MMSTTDPESSPFLDRRLGGFAIQLEWLENMRNKDAEEIFRNFRIIRAEIDYASKSVLYVGASEMFDPVAENEMAPSYLLRIDRLTPESPITIRVTRV